MKTQISSKVWIAVLVAMLALLGCPTDSDPAKNGAAALTSVSVAGAAVATVPTPFSQSEWGGVEALMDVEGAQLGLAIILNPASLTDAAIEVVASSGAQVRYAVGTSIDKPTEFGGSPVTLSNNGYLVIQVTAEDGKAVNYYVVQVKLASTTANLTGAKVDGVTAELGTPNAAWDQATAGSVVLSTAGEVAIDATKAVAGQTVKYAKVSGSGEPVFGDTATFSVADGDFLYIEVTAENNDKLVYKLEVQIGRDATLSALTIGGVPVSNQGTPAAALGDVAAGGISFETMQPAEGYAISITATDSAATVKWAAVASDTNQATFGTDSPIVFANKGYLYIEVKAANGTTTAYYKIQVSLTMNATIKYGKPEIKASADKFIDPLWATVTETYSIAKVYQTDSTATFIANPDTRGVAKALFDEDGLYVYVEVTDPQIDSTNNQAHFKDSVELFINEAVDANGDLVKDPVTYDSKGGQYRVGANGATSGNPTAAQTALNNLNKISAWTTDNGYVVIFQAPWRFKTNYPVEDGKKIGLDLQINACSSSNRDGVVVWNNIANGNYQNVSGYGEAVLAFPSTVEKIVAGGSSLPVYRFTPPAGSTWSDYKTITYTVMVADQASYDLTATRAYIGGSYQASNFNAGTGTFEKLQDWNDSRLVKISDGAVFGTLLGSPLNTWKVLSYPIVQADIPDDQKDGSYVPATYYPADTSTGPFFFSVGFTVNPNSGGDSSVTYYIKDVALVKADGSKLKADGLNETFGTTTLGQLRCIFSNNGGKVERTVE